MPFYDTRKLMLGKKIDMLQSLHFQIHYLTAVLTDKMIMRLGVPVKTVRSDPCGNRLDLPDIS